MYIINPGYNAIPNTISHTKLILYLPIDVYTRQPSTIIIIPTYNTISNYKQPIRHNDGYSRSISDRKRIP